MKHRPNFWQEYVHRREMERHNRERNKFALGCIVGILIEIAIFGIGYLFWRWLTQ